MTDKDFLKRAVKLAENGIEKGGGPFGAVVVRNGKIISESTNRVVHSTDPTAHAEILAIRQAAKVLGTHSLNDCILYSSCEPCPMCLGAIYWSGIKTVFFATDRKDAAAAGFNDKYIYDEISLPPEERHILFNRIPDVDGMEVFRIWNRFENKIPY
ncbi:MAG: tRNA-specific adenosine deaminase [Odoribacter sp.]|nr:tRNA-specific adenosine deaminase [Odoribacter sp.]